MPPLLVEAFGHPLPAGELLMWAAMNPDNRDTALARLRAVLLWETGDVGASANDVAAGLDVSRSRFYRMLSDWRRAPSLRALGVNAPAATTREVRSGLKKANETAQRLVGGVVDAGGQERVSVLARRLGEAVVESAGVAPKATLLRSMIERERRRRLVEASAGNEIVFDMSAVGIPGAGGLPHIMFACVDGASGWVFGFGFGDPAASRLGYRAAAADALARIRRGAPLPWTPGLSRAQVVIGPADAGWDGFFAAATAVTGANVQPKGSGGRVGGDLRRLLGDSIGSVRLLPAQTLTERPLAISVADAEFSAPEAKARLEVEVVAHNARQAALVEGGEGTPPSGLLRLLELLSG